MINVEKYTDKEVEEPLLYFIDNTYSEANKLLENLPDVLNIHFTPEGGSDITGIGAFAYSKNRINISFLKDFEDKQFQQLALHGAIFHESYHINQGFTYEDSPFTALQSAIYEGCAVVFEREYAKNTPPYADYSQHTELELEAWLDEVKKIGNEYFEDVTLWRKWAFYNDELEQKWIIYKLGVWLVDKTLRRTGLDIIDLRNMSADEIIKKGNLSITK